MTRPITIFKELLISRPLKVFFPIEYELYNVVLYENFLKIIWWYEKKVIPLCKCKFIYGITK